MARVVGAERGETGCFSEQLFRMIFKCDREQRQRLARVYPFHVEMVDRYQSRDGVIAHPLHQDAGRYVPMGDGMAFFGGEYE